MGENAGGPVDPSLSMDPHGSGLNIGGLGGAGMMSGADLGAALGPLGGQPLGFVGGVGGPLPNPQQFLSQPNNGAPLSTRMGGFQQELRSPEPGASPPAQAGGGNNQGVFSTARLRQSSPNLLDGIGLSEPRAPSGNAMVGNHFGTLPISEQINLDNLHIRASVLNRMGGRGGLGPARGEAGEAKAGAGGLRTPMKTPPPPHNRRNGMPTPVGNTPLIDRGPLDTPVKTPEKPQKLENGFYIEVDSILTGPEEEIVVRWTAPASSVRHLDWVGLYRVHQSEPDSCMTSKSVNLRSARKSFKTMHLEESVATEFRAGGYPNEDGLVSVEVLCGEMYFRAPPAIGRYDFRYYRDSIVQRPRGGNRHNDNRQQRRGKNDGKDKGEYEPPPPPHARSNMLTVEAQGLAFVDALRYLVKKIDASSGSKVPSGNKLREYAGACAQLVRLLEQLRADWEGRPLTYAKQLWPVILHSVKRNFEITDPRAKVNSRNERDILSIARTNRSIIAVARLNPAVRNLLEGGQIEQLGMWHERLLQMETETMLAAQAEAFGTKLHLRLPSSTDSAASGVPVFPEGVSKSVLERLTGAVNTIAPTFMPSAESQAQRQELFRRLDTMLYEDLQGLPGAYGVKLALFGSSANGFGSSTSDMDMCLNFDESGDARGGGGAMDPRELILRIAELLKARGLQDVDTSRVTARIPVIQFLDPATGLDCDICVNNHLALRNTMLLRGYSICDPRVKIIAYIIKVWSKRRDLNDPKNSTLSSYGFLLTIFMHMQRRISGNVSFFLHLTFRPSLPSIHSSETIPKPAITRPPLPPSPSKHTHTLCLFVCFPLSSLFPLSLPHRIEW